MLAPVAVLLAACTIGGTPAKCTTVVVPENRSEPAGAQIALNVAVLPATVARRSDPIFFITGGPGGVDTELVPYFAQAFAVVNAHRDLVFVDQRGVGQSNPLACAVTTPGLSLDQIVATCLGQTTADVSHYRTPDAMDDLDAVRQALGYGRIDVWGGSYGATAAQVYLRRHPDTVRTIVLDGPTLLDVPVFERWSSSAQRSLRLLAKRCRADRGCAKAFPLWFERFPALLARLAASPVHAGGITIDAAATASTVDELTASVGDAVTVPFVLARAESGAYEPLARAIAYISERGGPTTGTQLMPIEVMCTEPWAAADPGVVAADAAGTYMSWYYPASVVEGNRVCGLWPKVDLSAEDWSRVRSDVPALVLVGGADPKDPPANTAGVTDAMPNARVVTVPGGAHGVAQLGCIPALLDRFFERGTTAGLDTSCAARALVPYPSFRLH